MTPRFRQNRAHRSAWPGIAPEFGMLVLAFAQNRTGALLGASVPGIGFGCYLAVDFALIT